MVSDLEIEILSMPNKGARPGSVTARAKSGFRNEAGESKS